MAEGKRILFTGGSGKAGRHVVPYLVARGHRVVNVDLVPLASPGADNLTADITDSGQMFNVMTSYANFDELEHGRPGGTSCPTCSAQGHRVVNVDLVPLAAPGVDNLTADIADSGQMFDVMTSYANFDELEPGTGVPRFDAVVHFAAVPRILIRPDNETFRINTVGTYNVIEAAIKLGIAKIVIASSETTYGVCFADGTVDPKSLPVEEDYDVDPMDSYGLSKVLERSHRPRLRPPLRRGYLRASHRQRDRAARIRPLPRLVRRPGPAAAQPLLLHRRPRPRPDRRPLPRDRRPRLPGLQRRQRHERHEPPQPPSSSPASSRTCRSPARSPRTRRSSPTARSARSSASARSTTGAATSQAERR